MPVINDNETSANLFRKLSIAIKNIRYLLKLIGTTDISTLGDGTVTDAISSCYQDVADGKTLLVEALTDKKSIPDDDSFQKLADAINSISGHSSWTAIVNVSFYERSILSNGQQFGEGGGSASVTIKCTDGVISTSNFKSTTTTVSGTSNYSQAWVTNITINSFTWDD